MRPTRDTPPVPARLERALVRVAADHAPLLLRLSIGVVFLWFAIPKFTPGLSAVDGIAVRTIGMLTLHHLTGHPARLLLALLETAIAAGLLTGRLPRLTLATLFFHMAGTLTPLLLFPGDTWKRLLVPTLEGQFILKNLIIIAAAVALVGTRRRGMEPAPMTAPPGSVVADGRGDLAT